MKIDLVYMWVDGSDEKWIAKKNACLGIDAKTSGTRDSRWMDHDELLYSLRSAEKFAPWINHIYIVTDGQTPKWLNINNPNITVVDHKDIIPEKYLPLFNSVAIEMFLHNIPGLSEHFLYANDDMFFGKNLIPDFFFDENGNPIVIMKERKQKFKEIKPSKHRIYQQQILRAVNFIFRKFGIKFNLTFKHAIEPIRKSFMRENFERYLVELEATTITRFRQASNLQRIIFPMSDNAMGRNKIVLNWRVGNRRIEYDYKKNRRFIHSVLWVVATVFGFVKYDCYDKEWRLIHFLKKYRPGTFTINDFGTNFEAAFGFLNSLYPNPSKYEKESK